ncbi:MAG: hypothetical protein IKJ46_04150, partial [Tidjanibacter sp.]|nr:hypothetical protein [Tidjanibacter sp.]
WSGLLCLCGEAPKEECPDGRYDCVSSHLSLFLTLLMLVVGVWVGVVAVVCVLATGIHTVSPTLYWSSPLSPAMRSFAISTMPSSAVGE